jgi:transmembrane sensor
VPSIDEVRDWAAGGRAGEAVEAARAARARGEDVGAWRLVEADALRALGRHGEAADAYDQAAREGAGGRAALAGFLAASLRFGQLGDPAGALASLEAAHSADPGSPFAERASALRVRALDRLGRGDEARAAARDYLERFPQGGLADWMRALLGESAEP